MMFAWADRLALSADVWNCHEPSSWYPLASATDPSDAEPIATAPPIPNNK
jgi:hypothetical protein